MHKVKFIKRKSNAILFVLICIWTIVLVICNTIYGKKTVHFDELFSYGSANTLYNYEVMVGDREWKNSKEMFNDYLSVDWEDRFNYQMVWANQSGDVHPPLYYAVIHTICSLMPGKFTIWIAVWINLFFLILTLPALYLISRKLFINDQLALEICFCFITSNLTISIVMFLRMYVMLLCITTWLTYLHIRWLENTKNRKLLFLIFGVTVLGALTHYYFLVFLFFMAIGCCISLFIDKNYKDIIFYCASIGAAGVLFVLSYPASIQHIFYGYRGSEAFSNIKTLDNYPNVLLNYLFQLGQEMFRIKWGLIIVIALVAAAALYIFLKQSIFKKNRGGRKGFALILFTAMGYFGVITKISAMQTSRYISPLFPLIYLILLGSIYLLLHERMNATFYFLIFVIGALGLFNWKNWGSDNLLKQTKIAKQYAGYDCLLMAGEEDWSRAYNAMNNYYQLIEYNKLYFVSMPYENDFVDEKLLEEEELIVYIDSQDDIKSNQELLLRELPQMSEFDFLYDASESKVYLMR